MSSKKIESLVSRVDTADILTTKLRRLRKVLNKWKNIGSVQSSMLRRRSRVRLIDSLERIHEDRDLNQEECNTPLPEYVLSCVFRFFDHIFRFIFCICFVL